MGNPPTDIITNLRFSNPTNHLLVPSCDRSIHLYDASANVLRGEFKHGRPVLDCCSHDNSSGSNVCGDSTVPVPREDVQKKKNEKEQKNVKKEGKQKKKNEGQEKKKLKNLIHRRLMKCVVYRTIYNTGVIVWESKEFLYFNSVLYRWFYGIQTVIMVDSSYEEGQKKSFHSYLVFRRSRREDEFGVFEVDYGHDLLVKYSAELLHDGKLSWLTSEMRNDGLPLTYFKNLDSTLCEMRGAWLVLEFFIKSGNVTDYLMLTDCKNLVFRVEKLKEEEEDKKKKKEEEEQNEDKEEKKKKKEDAEKSDPKRAAKAERLARAKLIRRELIQSRGFLQFIPHDSTEPADLLHTVIKTGYNQDSTKDFLNRYNCIRRWYSTTPSVHVLPPLLGQVTDKSFGFDTAVEAAQRAINAAHVEAESGENGVGVVKLMGRDSGYIALYATLASRDVDCCLIPESPFYLEGPGGLFEYMEKRLKENGHMVIVIAEGAGQVLISECLRNIDAKDASGNKLHQDVGLWISQKIKEYFKQKDWVINLIYIDPTCMIRAIPANASDNVYCTLLAQRAIYGAMAGYTGFTVGPVNRRHAYIPFQNVMDYEVPFDIAHDLVHEAKLDLNPEDVFCNDIECLRPSIASKAEVLSRRICFGKHLRSSSSRHPLVGNPGMGTSLFSSYSMASFPHHSYHTWQAVNFNTIKPRELQSTHVKPSSCNYITSARKPATSLGTSQFRSSPSMSTLHHTSHTYQAVDFYNIRPVGINNVLASARVCARLIRIAKRSIK